MPVATRGTTGSTSRSNIGRVLATVCVVVIVALSAAGHSRAAAPSRKDLSSSLKNPSGGNPATSSALPSTIATRNGDRSDSNKESSGAAAAAIGGGGRGGDDTVSGLIDTHEKAVTARALTATSTSAPIAALASTPTSGPKQAPTAAPPIAPTSVTSPASTTAPVTATTAICGYPDRDTDWTCYEPGDAPCNNSQECQDVVSIDAAKFWKLRISWGCAIDPIFEAACFPDYASMCYKSRCFGFFPWNVTAYTDDGCAGCNAVGDLEFGYLKGEYQNAENGSLIAS